MKGKVEGKMSQRYKQAKKNLKMGERKKWWHHANIHKCWVFIIILSLIVSLDFHRAFNGEKCPNMDVIGTADIWDVCFQTSSSWSSLNYLENHLSPLYVYWLKPKIFMTVNEEYRYDHRGWEKQQ